MKLAKSLHVVSLDRASKGLGKVGSAGQRYGTVIGLVRPPSRDRQCQSRLTDSAWAVDVQRGSGNKLLDPLW